MKKTCTLILLILLAFLFGTPQGFSQESISPLMRSDTIVAANLNLKNFDFDRFAQNQVDRIDSLFEKLNYNDVSREAIAREAKTLIANKLSLVRPLYQMFIMGTKLDEIYVVSYAEGLKTVPAIIATPLEGKSASQIAMIESFFNDAPIKPFRFEGFLILAVPCSPDNGEQAAQWVKTHLQKSEPAAGMLFLNVSDDTIFRAIVIKPENIQELLDSADLSNVPPQALAVLNMVLEKFQWVSFGFDPYAFSAELIVQTASETDAEELLELIQATQEAGIESLRLGLHAGIAKGAQDNPALLFFAEYVPLLTEIARGAVRQTLPQIDGAKLIFSCQ